MQDTEQLIDTRHDDHIHDVAWDYYARRLATASSDRTIKVWAVDGETHALQATIEGHEGPVWEVAWAHPKHGAVLASCSYDGTVRVHREDAPGRWLPAHAWAPEGAEAASINSIAWAPEGVGSLMLACGGADGHATVLAHDAATGEWGAVRFLASPLGCNAVSWCPTECAGSSHADGSVALRLATGCADALVKVWRAAPPSADGAVAWEAEPMAQGGRLHKGWVRDVAFAPFYGAPQPCLASCSEDKSVYVWTRGDLDGPWVATRVRIFDAPCWRVSWSVTGNILAVSSGDDDVSLWKESLTGDWAEVAKPEPAAPN